MPSLHVAVYGNWYFGLTLKWGWLWWKVEQELEQRVPSSRSCFRLGPGLTWPRVWRVYVRWGGKNKNHFLKLDSSEAQRSGIKDRARAEKRLKKETKRALGLFVIWRTYPIWRAPNGQQRLVSILMLHVSYRIRIAMQAGHDVLPRVLICILLQYH